MEEFASWLCRVSQETNRSLAGSTVYLPSCSPNRETLALAAAEWGLIQVDVQDEADLVFPELLREAAQNVPAAARLAVSTSASHVPSAQASSLFDRAKRGMPVCDAIARELKAAGILRDVRVAVSLMIEPKTAVLLHYLVEAGACVGAYCHAHECNQVLADELCARGFQVEACSSWTPSDEREGALRLLDNVGPQVVIDDGANLARLLVMERPELLKGFVGVAEETTSGVRAFEAMERAGDLPFPVVAVNDSRLKTDFDNRHGTGETCVTTLLKLLGADYFWKRCVCVIGFGPVGEGFARRVRVLGAQVTVVDTDPRASLRALFAGFHVEAAPAAMASADMVVSATGVRHTLSIDELRLMHEGTCIAVCGGIANEVALDEVFALGGAIQEAGRPGVSFMHVPGGSCVELVAAGNGVNYTEGPGNPIQIMDLSFAVQLRAVEYLVRHAGELENRVVRLSDEMDQAIASTALACRGVAQQSSVREPLSYDWRCTRYEDTGKE